MAKNTRDSDVEFVRALAELLRANDLTELEVTRDFGEDDSLTVRVAKQSSTVVQTVAAPTAAAPAIAAAPTADATPTAEPDAAGDPAQLPGAVTSPMVGTCYLQPEPGTPAFVGVGDTVKEGQTVIIIEAGKVSRILVEDGTPVEFGAPLMIID